ncbi:MAG: alkaline phosphatase [bacterium]|nr:alkaline phosphatase [bacterium]
MRIQKNLPPLLAVSALALMLSACVGSDNNPAASAPAPKNVIFFLGDGMGMTTLTAARIYAVGEEGDLTIDTLPETAFVRTFSEDAQVTDSAPSMAAYMTGVKMRNDVISMQTGTVASAPSATATSTCDSVPENAGKQPVETLLELAKARGMGTGVVTTTRITHATPATTYAHVCHRDAENDIAAQMVPGGSGTGYGAFNARLKDGIDVVLGGGLSYFKTTANGGKRADGRDLVNEMKAKGYTYVSKGSELGLVVPAADSKLLGLFGNSHMSYDLDRTGKNLDEPSLSDMTAKAIDVLKAKNKNYFLMVEGGRIDHALHDTNAKRALQDTKAFDDAIRTALDKVDLSNTLIVVTADHDHTLVLNGYARRTGKYVKGVETSVLGLVKNYNAPGFAKDANNNPYPIIGFGNGKKRPESNRGDDRVTALTDSDSCNAVAGPAAPAGKTYSNTYGGTFWCTGAASDDFQQEAVIQTGYADNETHGGTDVFLGAAGVGADNFHGNVENIEVFGLVRKAIGL